MTAQRSSSCAYPRSGARAILGNAEGTSFRPAMMVPGLRVGDDHCEPPLRVGWIERHKGGPRHQRRQHGDRQITRARQANPDSVPRPTPLLRQHAGETLGVAQKRCIRQVAGIVGDGDGVRRRPPPTSMRQCRAARRSAGPQDYHIAGRRQAEVARFARRRSDDLVQDRPDNRR